MAGALPGLLHQGQRLQVLPCCVCTVTTMLAHKAGTCPRHCSGRAARLQIRPCWHVILMATGHSSQHPAIFRALIPVIQLARAESAGPASCADLHTDPADQRPALALLKCQLSSCLSGAKLSQVLPDADPIACADPSWTTMDSHMQATPDALPWAPRIVVT